MADYHLAYWIEAVSEALCEVEKYQGFNVGQIEQMAKFLMTSAEHQAMAFGCPENPLIHEMSEQKKKFTRDTEQMNQAFDRERAARADDRRAYLQRIWELEFIIGKMKGAK